MSRVMWQPVPDEELVNNLSMSAYLLYKNSNPRIVVYRHQLTGLYRIALYRDFGFTLAEGLVSLGEVNEYFVS